MRYLLLFMLAVGLFVINRHNGCFFGFDGLRGKGPTKTETRELSNFHKLTIDLSGDINVEPSETFRVEITAQENLLPNLKTEVEGGEILRLYFDKNVRRSGDIKITVYAPNLDAITLNGSADVDVNTPLRGEKLRLDLSGSGNITVVQADFAKVSCDVNGSGEMKIAGTATDFDADISGSGSVDALNLSAQNAEADISGSGSVNCNAEQTLRANVSGSGDIRYKGNATVSKDLSGSGSITKI